MLPHLPPQISAEMTIYRRTFWRFSSAALAVLSLQRLADGTPLPTSKVRLGLIADLHQDLVPDARPRLEKFLEVSSEQKVDALIQLGDFATPIAKNQSVIDLFGRVSIPKFHVIGNHDTDGGLKISQVVDKWNMKGRFYSEVVQGIKLIILDCNDKPKGHRGGYPAHIAEDQLTWLRSELEHPGPMLIFSHQPLAGPAAIDNATEVQQLLSAAADRVLLAINGHTHIDELIEVKGIPYWHVNSASYYWVGSEYKHESLSKELHEKYPWMSSTCPYKDPLFAFLEIDLANGSLTMTGRQSKWLGASPSELGVVNKPGLASEQQIVPTIRNRSLSHS
jgi:predicted phosphodiesterase